MFFKNDLRPALASASNANFSSGRSKKNNSITMRAAETDDFNSFSSTTGRYRPQHQPRRPKKNTTTIEINGRSLIIAIASLLAAVVLIVLVAMVITSASKNITFKDNSFISYQDVDGNYRIAKNGKLLNESFANEIELIPAADNSFAYVLVTADEGYDLYVIEKNELTPMCQGISSKPLAYAEFEPGAIYIQRGRTTYYFDGVETVLTGSEEPAKDVVISPDGKAVAYSCASKTNESTTSLYLYNVKNTVPEQISSGKDSMVPVSISDNGKYVIAYSLNSTDKITKELYVFFDSHKYRIAGTVGSFEQILYANADATEIVFTTSTGTDDNSHSYIYNCKETGERKKNTAHDIGVGKCMPQVSDPEIVRLDSLKKNYFQNLDKKSTFYVNKKYETNSISSFLGKFDSKSEHFYFINEQKSMLCKMKVQNGKADPAKLVAYDVEEFFVTQKGNLYYIDSYHDLSFYKISQEKPIRITGDVINVKFYNYANRLYFEQVDSLDVSSVYATSEGSDPEAVKFGKTEVKILPEFTHPHSQKSYAYYENAETGNKVLFYSSNGRTFKQITDGAIFED